jgi:hypothetical protein
VLVAKLENLKIKVELLAAGLADKKSPAPWGWLAKVYDQMKDLTQNVRNFLDTTSPNANCRQQLAISNIITKKITATIIYLKAEG